MPRFSVYPPATVTVNGAMMLGIAALPSLCTSKFATMGVPCTSR